MLGEEHNVVEIPELTAALLHDLQGTAGYHYLALETRHYMPASKAEDFARLDSAFSPARGSEAALLIDNLVRSDRIYRSYRDGRGYDNGYSARS